MDNENIKNIDFNKDAKKLLDAGYSKDELIILRRYGNKTVSDVINSNIKNRTLYCKVINPECNNIHKNINQLIDNYYEVLIKYLNIHIYNGYIPDETLEKINSTFNIYRKKYNS